MEAGVVKAAGGRLDFTRQASPMEKEWRDWVGSVFVMAVIVALVYAAVGSIAEWANPRLKPPRKQERTIHPDLYVYHPKSYVDSAASAEELIGRTLWVMEGYRWIYEPGEQTFEPLEKIVPTGVRSRGEQTLLEFERDGRTHTVAIGTGERFYVDAIFLLKNPHELYAHWTPADWEKIEAYRVEPGMTEYQTAFALGAGSLARYSPGGALRILDYTFRRSAGLPALRVTFMDGLVTKVEPLGADE